MAAEAYARNSNVVLLSAECGIFDPLYPETYITRITWDTNAGKPTKWEIIDTSSIAFLTGKFTRKDLVAGSKVIGTPCQGLGLRARISNRDSNYMLNLQNAS